MVGRAHNELLKGIRRYASQFNEGNLPHVDFFNESTYQDSKGQERPCYDVTKKVVNLLVIIYRHQRKSTVLRAIITNLILMSKVKLHLVDLKNGAEFNVFRKSSRVETFCRNISETERLLMSLSVETDKRYDIFEPYRNRYYFE